MKSSSLKRLIVFTCLLLTITFEVSADTDTTTQTTGGINTSPQKCGISITSDKNWLIVNDNDDNVDEKWDLDVEPVADEKDTLKITVTGTADKSEGTVTIEILESVDKINRIDGFWPGTLTIDGDVVGTNPPNDPVQIATMEKNGKEKRSTKITSFKVPAGKTSIQTLYIEGIKNSSTLGDVKIKATIVAPAITLTENGVEKNYKECKAETDPNLELTVYQVDLDVDSKNDDAFAFAGFDKPEDEIEASEKAPKKPGKYIFVNAGFSANDNEAAPGWADGFEVGGAAGVAAATSVARDAQFTPVQIELKEPFDPAKAKIKFEYSAADPKLVTRTAGGGTPSEPFTYALGVSDKHLRIWKKDFATTASSSRNKKNVDDTGDYVQDNKDLEWAKIASGRNAQIFLEAVKPSTTLGDLSINIIVTQDGVTATDTVNITSVYLTEPVLTITPTAGATYTLFQNALTSTGGPAVTYSVSTKFTPNGVDCSKIPLSNIRSAIMQNVTSSNRIVDYHNPIYNGPDPATYPAGVTVSYPSSGSQTLAISPPRICDAAPVNGIPWPPLYAVFPSPPAGTSVADALGKPLNCPGGAATTSNDTPTHGGPYVRPLLVDPATGGVVAAAVYSPNRIRMDDDFVTWCTGYDAGNKTFYPLLENTWDIDIDSDVVGAQVANVGAAPVPPTMVPVRTPLANTVGASASPPFVATPGAVTITLP